MQLFKRNVSSHELILFAVEMMVICAAMVVAMRLHGAAGHVAVADPAGGGAVPAVPVLQRRLRSDARPSGRELLVRLVQAAGAASIILGILYLAVPSIAVQGLPFVQSLAILLVAIPAGRALFTHVARTSLLVDQVLIVGTGQAPREVARELQMREDPAYHVVGYVDDTPEPRATLGSLPVLGGAPGPQRADRTAPHPLDRRRPARPPQPHPDRRAGARPSSRGRGSRTPPPPTSA